MIDEKLITRVALLVKVSRFIKLCRRDGVAEIEIERVREREGERKHGRGRKGTEEREIRTDFVCLCAVQAGNFVEPVASKNIFELRPGISHR